MCDKESKYLPLLKNTVQNIENNLQEKFQKSGKEKVKGTEFEEIVQDALIKSGFHKEQITHSSQKFPDFVITDIEYGYKIGVEVKKTDSNKWEVIGGSVFESLKNDVEDTYIIRLCHNKQLINSHFYRGVSELPYKLLFAVIYTHLEFRYEVSHTITSHHVHHFHQTRIPDGTLLDYMVQYRKPLFPQFFLYPKKFLPENNPHHKEFHLRPYIQNNANQ